MDLQRACLASAVTRERDHSGARYSAAKRVEEAAQRSIGVDKANQVDGCVTGALCILSTIC